VVLRDYRGHILVIGAGSLGHTTNNAAELWGLIKGLQLAIKYNFTKLFVEGDSQVVPPDGVIVRSTRQSMEAGGGLQDVGARERLVPPPGG
jgi:hypothetical protein